VGQRHGDADPLEPLWLGRGLNQVATSADITERNDTYRVTNSGPDRLPAGTTVAVTHLNETANLTLSESVGVNESVYVYYPAGGGSARLSTTQPDAGSAATPEG
jgi:hypothetical protein